jgi:hypothetical protein
MALEKLYQNVIEFYLINLIAQLKINVNFALLIGDLYRNGSCQLKIAVFILTLQQVHNQINRSYKVLSKDFRRELDATKRWWLIDRLAIGVTFLPRNSNGDNVDEYLF